MPPLVRDLLRDTKGKLDLDGSFSQDRRGLMIAYSLSLGAGGEAAMQSRLGDVVRWAQGRGAEVTQAEGLATARGTEGVMAYRIVVELDETLPDSGSGPDYRLDAEVEIAFPELRLPSTRVVNDLVGLTGGAAVPPYVTEMLAQQRVHRIGCRRKEGRCWSWQFVVDRPPDAPTLEVWMRNNSANGFESAESPPATIARDLFARRYDYLSTDHRCAPATVRYAVEEKRLAVEWNWHFFADGRDVGPTLECPKDSAGEVAKQPPPTPAGFVRIHHFLVSEKLKKHVEQVGACYAKQRGVKTTTGWLRWGTEAGLMPPQLRVVDEGEEFANYGVGEGRRQAELSLSKDHDDGFSFEIEGRAANGAIVILRLATRLMGPSDETVELHYHEKAWADRWDIPHFDPDSNAAQELKRAHTLSARFPLSELNEVLASPARFRTHTAGSHVGPKRAEQFRRAAQELYPFSDDACSLQ